MTLRTVESAGLSDVGRQRQTNEDRFLDAPPLFAVADGMGGARAGEVASAIAVDAFGAERDLGESPEAQLAEIVLHANRRIHRLAQEDESRAGMGTTLTAVLVTDHELAVAHVGDSRLYLLRDGRLERLTEDHSLVEEWVRQGRLAPEAAEHHPQKSVILRALGPEADVQVDTFTLPGRDGDVYLLCSDGLTGMISEQEVEGILLRGRSLDEGAQELVASANANGGRDNITVVLFRLGEEDGRRVDADTLSGAEGAPQVTTAEVRAAAAAREPGGARRVTPQAGGDHDPGTLMIEPAAAARLRATAAAEAPTQPGPRPAPRDRAPATEPRPARRRPPARPARRRRVGKAAVWVLAVAAVVAGLWVASRQVFFVGADEVGAVTLYRGLPYDLPFGISLYETEYRSRVPARALEPRQRERVLDHQLRGRGDAEDLVRQLERGQARR